MVLIVNKILPNLDAALRCEECLLTIEECLEVLFDDEGVRITVEAFRELEGTFNIVMKLSTTVLVYSIDCTE